MDYIAANVAYRYCIPASEKNKSRDELSFYAVTASIDQIEFYHPVKADVDCELSGYVSYVGKSSMEIQIDVLQEVSNERRLNCSAKFVMVARDKQTNKPHQVPQLNIENEKEIFKIIYELGEQRQLIRKE
jgi:acyl-coenzyme A thioesterase 9